MQFRCRSKFLGAGKFKAKIWEDGATPTTLKESERGVSSSDVLELKLAPSGGAAVRVSAK
jgi:alpha-glucosidase